MAMSSATATWLFFAAYAIIFIGILIIVFDSFSRTTTSGGGAVVIIGPIPIIIGAGEQTSLLVFLAVALTALSVVPYFILRRKRPA